MSDRLPSVYEIINNESITTQDISNKIYGFLRHVDKLKQTPYCDYYKVEAEVKWYERTVELLIAEKERRHRHELFEFMAKGGQVICEKV